MSKVKKDKKDKADKKISRILKFAGSFVIFFLPIAFAVSCCIVLFVSTAEKAMGITLSPQGIAPAAKITLLNLIFLTAVFTVCDAVRRNVTVHRPTKKILEAGRKVMEGDFSVRISTSKGQSFDDPFNDIAECFNEMAKELSRTETLRTDFVSNVSHELKTPLAVMQSYGVLLSQPCLEEEKRLEYAEEITSASQKLAVLVSNVLKLSKLENQQILPSPRRYNLSEQICECLLGFEKDWEKKELNIETRIEDDVYVCSDAEMLSIVWNNLLSNAVKFTDEGGTVTVSLNREGDFVSVRIKDTGCGISNEVGKRIFDKFYQGDTSHATEGNGLGLALVKRVIDITGNDVSVESRIGKGTEFTVRLRRADGESKSEKEANEANN